MKLIVVKPGRYGTRRLKAGDAFETSAQYGRIWVALGHARPVPTDEHVSMRHQAAALGLKVDGRWSKARLQREVAAAAKAKEQKPAQPSAAPAPPPPAPPPDSPAGRPVAATPMPIRGEYGHRGLRSSED
jgi:hypothetical protein